jgi:hypothetical protein
VPQDEAIALDDVDLPPGRFVDGLFAEQSKLFGV